MKINRKGSASWSGGLKDGKGSISTESGALVSVDKRMIAAEEKEIGRGDLDEVAVNGLASE